MPAAGSTAIGSIRLLPSRCNCAKPGMRSRDFTCFTSGFVVSLISTDLLCCRCRPAEAQRQLSHWAVPARPTCRHPRRPHYLFLGAHTTKESTVTTTPVLAPVAGRAVRLHDVPDPVFSQGMVGYGAAVDPMRTVVEAVAPAGGGSPK